MDRHATVLREAMLDAAPRAASLRLQVHGEDLAR